MPRRLTVVGSANLDIGVRVGALPLPGETVVGRELTESPGGKGGNAAVAAALLGGDVRFVGAVGTDAAATTLREALVRSGVDVDALASVDGPSGTALIELDDAGENRIVVVPGANDYVAIGPRAAKAILSSAAILLSLEIPVDAALHAAAVAAEAGVTVVLNLSPFRPLPDSLFRLVDVLIVNEHEAAALFGTDGFELDALADHARTCARLGIRSLVVTLGGDGAALIEDTRTTEVALLPGMAVRVLDTTGCGDAFAGALALALARGETLTEAVRFGNRVGAFAAQRRGAQSSYPSEADLRDLLTTAG